MKRFGLMFAHAGMSAILMSEAAADGGEGGGGADVAAAAAVAASVKLTAADKGNVQEEVKPTQKGDDEVLAGAGYAATEDKGLNYAMTFLAKNGYGADHPAVEAAWGGDFSLLKAELSAKGIQGWEQAVGLGEQAYGRAQEAHAATEKQVGELAVGIATEAGVDWEEAVSHISSTASDAERAALNSLLADPATATIAAHFITNQFLATGQSEYQPVPAANGDQTMANAAPQNGGPISRAEYTKGMKELFAKYGNNYTNTAEAQALYKRLKG